MARKRTRRPRARVAPTRATKKSGNGQSQTAQVQALKNRLQKLEVNTSPFASVGGTVGRSIGGLFGRPGIGSNIGSWLGSGVGKIFGSGPYKMKSNTSWSTGDQCPVMHSNSENVIVRHREYIADISSSTSFVNREYPINPGLLSTFPFLATIGANFQEYDFRGLVFEFKSTSADALNSTNTALGTVAMAIQYRAGATSFTNKQQVLNEMWSADSKPSESFFMPVECSPAECPMDIQYVRTAGLAPNEDIKFYDLGRLSVSTVGSQAVAVVGELWATYEVALKKPVLSGAIGTDAQSAFTVRAQCTVAAPLGTVQINAVNNFIGVVFTSNTVTVPAGHSGKYLVNLFWYGGIGTWSLPGIPSITNSVTITTDGNSTQDAGNVAAVSFGMSRTFILSIIDSTLPCVMTLAADGLFGATPRFEYAISQIDYDTTAT